MALKIQPSFSGGELDPALHEFTTLEKYKRAAKTLRNTVVGKTGRVTSRGPRKKFKQAKLSDKTVILYSPPNSGFLIEFGHLYARIYSFDASLNGITAGSLVDEFTHSLTEDDLPYVHFDKGGSTPVIHVFRSGSNVMTLYYDSAGPGFVVGANNFSVPTAPSLANITTASGTGYEVDYLVTAMVNGQESAISDVKSSDLPITAGEFNLLVGTLGTTSGNNFREMRVYRRPKDGGAFGYIGSSSRLYTSGAYTVCDFKDVGQEADYSNTPPTQLDSVTNRGASGPATWLSPTGCFYQQRLLLADVNDYEAIQASRIGFPGNFTRDWPLSSDGALTMKCGSSGRAAVLRMIDSDGLVVFTAVGVFLHTGALSPTNLALAKKGNWVINDRVPPIPIPGGVLFIDKATNVVRQLSWSEELKAYGGDELSVFSNHLFQGKLVVSWAFQEGDTPLLWAVFNDGSYASFTFEREQQMRAWTRHDTQTVVADEIEDVNVEFVCGTGVADTTFFVVEKDGDRYIEQTIPRYVTAAVAAADAQSHLNESNALMDSMVSYKTVLNDSLGGTDEFVFHAMENDNWDGDIRVRCGTSAIFTAGTYGALGTVMRIFGPDGAAVDLTVKERVTDNEILVTPSSTFPEDEAENNLNLYATATTFTGLTHLEGEHVAVMVDGAVVSSPNNDIENYDECTVESGSLTLPNSMRGAIVHIGRAVTCDVRTLAIDTVEQRPVLLESKLVNKLYAKIHNTRGLYVGNEFPEDDKVNGMQPVDQFSVDYTEDNPIIGNRAKRPTSKRVELSTMGSWSGDGEVCFRQVDPIHFELLSISPDVEDLRRE